MLADGTHDAQNDRLTLLLVARPREGFEDLYEMIVRREIERLEGIGKKEKAEPRSGAGRGIPEAG